MRDEFDEQVRAAGLGDFSSRLQAMVQRTPVPDPSPDLADIFVGGVIRPVYVSPVSRLRLVAGAAVIVLGSGVTAAAAADTLPVPVQRVVSKVVEVVTPLEVPSHGRDPAERPMAPVTSVGESHSGRGGEDQSSDDGADNSSKGSSSGSDSSGSGSSGSGSSGSGSSGSGSSGSGSSGSGSSGSGSSGSGTNDGSDSGGVSGRGGGDSGHGGHDDTPPTNDHGGHGSG